VKPIAILIPFLFAMPWPLAAQAPPDPQRVGRLAFIPEEQQRQNVRQQVFTDWFLYRVQIYQQALSGYAIGALVNLGDYNAYRNRMRLYGGAQDWYVIWRDRAGGGPTKEIGEPFIFPNDGNLANLLNAGNPGTFATCWHELQHGILEEYWLSAPGLAGATQEHFYIEFYAQNTVAWLLELNRQRRFETYARQAFEQQEAQRRKGVEINYEAQRQMWARAIEAWSLSWELVPDIRVLDPALRDEYYNYAGVRVPTLEEVITFYMQGHLRTASGQPVLVPEWVMASVPIAAPVAFDHNRSRDTSAVAQGILRHTTRFDARGIVGGTRQRVRVTRGQITVRLDTDDDMASLALRLGTQPLAGVAGPGGPSNRRFQIDLATFEPALTAGDSFELTFIHRKVADVQGSKTFRVAVEYRDGGSPPVFAPSSAVFLFDVKGSGPPPATAAPPKPPPAAPPAPDPAGTWDRPSQATDPGLEGVWRGTGKGGIVQLCSIAELLNPTCDTEKKSRAALPTVTFAASINRMGGANQYHVQFRPDLGFPVRLLNAFRSYRNRDTGELCVRLDYGGDGPAGFRLEMTYWRNIATGSEWITAGASNACIAGQKSQCTTYSVEKLVRSGPAAPAPSSPAPAPTPPTAATPAAVVSQAAMQAPPVPPVPPQMDDVPPQNGTLKPVTVVRVAGANTGRRRNPGAAGPATAPGLCGPIAAWSRANLVEAGVGTDTAGAAFAAGTYWTFFAPVEPGVSYAQWKWLRTGPWAFAGGMRYALNHTGAVTTQPGGTTPNDASVRYVNGAATPVAFYICRDGGAAAQGNLRVVVEAEKDAAKIGEAVLTRTRVTSGVPPYQYMWFDGRRVSSAQTPNVRWTMTTTGAHTFSVLVTDSAGNVAEARTQIVVEPAASPRR
jgi:hypothetical protein